MASSLTVSIATSKECRECHMTWKLHKTRGLQSQGQRNYLKRADNKNSNDNWWFIGSYKSTNVLIALLSATVVVGLK